jgi:V/A-type H+/Na+-transporting ATPase subunit E
VRFNFGGGMEKTLEKGEDKIQKICDALRKETLEPAKKEAEELVAEAKARGEQIIADARAEAEKILAHAKVNIEQERNIFHSSLEQSAKQGLEELRQTIEKKLFNDELQHLVSKQTRDPKVIAKLVEAMVKAVEKEGVKTDISAIIPQTVKPADVNALLAEGILNRLKEGGVVVGGFSGGVQVKLHGEKMTIDMTEQSLIDLLSKYLRKDFREMVFGNS